MLLGALSAFPAEAQVVSLSPSTLANVPKGATDSSPYWQRLLIELSQDPSIGNTIAIGLPEGVSIADVDGDGSYEDEIALE